MWWIHCSLWHIFVHLPCSVIYVYIISQKHALKLLCVLKLNCRLVFPLASPSLFFVLTAFYFLLNTAWFVPLNKYLSALLFTWIPPPPKQCGTGPVIMHRSTVVFSFLLWSHICHTFLWLWPSHHHRASKQSRLSSARAAPKHIGYSQTSKTHYQVGHLLEIETYSTFQDCGNTGWQWTGSRCT